MQNKAYALILAIIFIFSYKNETCSNEDPTSIHSIYSHIERDVATSANKGSFGTVVFTKLWNRNVAVKIQGNIVNNPKLGKSEQEYIMLALNEAKYMESFNIEFKGSKLIPEFIACRKGKLGNGKEYVIIVMDQMFSSFDPDNCKSKDGIEKPCALTTMKSKSPLERMEIYLKMARGLELIHSKKLAHHDIKPANIVADEKLEIVKIIDWGVMIEENEFKIRGSVCYFDPLKLKHWFDPSLRSICDKGNKHSNLCDWRKNSRADIWALGITVAQIECYLNTGSFDFPDIPDSYSYMKAVNTIKDKYLGDKACWKNGTMEELERFGFFGLVEPKPFDRLLEKMLVSQRENIKITAKGVSSALSDIILSNSSIHQRVISQFETMRENGPIKI